MISWAFVCLSFYIFHMCIFLLSLCLFSPTTTVDIPFVLYQFLISLFFCHSFSFGFLVLTYIPVQVNIYIYIAFYFFHPLRLFWTIEPPILLVMVKLMAMVGWYDYLIFLVFTRFIWGIHMPMKFEKGLL